jgi:hypothetical protein
MIGMYHIYQKMITDFSTISNNPQIIEIAGLHMYGFNLLAENETITQILSIYPSWHMVYENNYGQIDRITPQGIAMTTLNRCIPLYACNYYNMERIPVDMDGYEEANKYLKITHNITQSVFATQEGNRITCNVSLTHTGSHIHESKSTRITFDAIQKKYFVHGDLYEFKDNYVDWYPYSWGEHQIE